MATCAGASEGGSGHGHRRPWEIRTQRANAVGRVHSPEDEESLGEEPWHEGPSEGNRTSPQQQKKTEKRPGQGHVSTRRAQPSLPAAIDLVGRAISMAEKIQARMQEERRRSEQVLLRCGGGSARSPGSAVTALEAVDRGHRHGLMCVDQRHAGLSAALSVAKSLHALLMSHPKGKEGEEREGKEGEEGEATGLMKKHRELNAAGVAPGEASVARTPALCDGSEKGPSAAAWGQGEGASPPPSPEQQGVVMAGDGRRPSLANTVEGAVEPSLNADGSLVTPGDSRGDPQSMLPCGASSTVRSEKLRELRARVEGLLATHEDMLLPPHDHSSPSRESTSDRPAAFVSSPSVDVVSEAGVEEWIDQALRTEMELKETLVMLPWSSREKEEEDAGAGGDGKVGVSSYRTDAFRGEARGEVRCQDKGKRLEKGRPSSASVPAGGGEVGEPFMDALEVIKARATAAMEGLARTLTAISLSDGEEEEGEEAPRRHGRWGSQQDRDVWSSPVTVVVPGKRRRMDPPRQARSAAPHATVAPHHQRNGAGLVAGRC